MVSDGAFSSIPLDRASLPQGRLDIDRRVRTNPLPWTGQFSPQLVETLLTAYAPRGGVVLDPFVGSGTTLGEAARARLSGCGCDLNPAAVFLARVYEFANLSTERRMPILRELDGVLAEEFTEPHGPLFQDNPSPSTHPDRLEASLVALWHDSASRWMRIVMAALIILCDFRSKHLELTRIHTIWRRLRQVIITLPESKSPITVRHADARELPVETNSVDLVLTSPPYINVFNYHQKYRHSVEALAGDVLAFARSEIGSNRQNRGNRFLTVAQYALDMVLAIREAARSTKKREGRLVFVLGRESSVRGTRFFNGEIIAELAVRGVGLTLEKRQARQFKNRYGTCIHEDILHFRASEGLAPVDSCLGEARRIAKEVLSGARERTSETERSGLEDAITLTSEVSPSPMAPDILAANNP